MDERAQKRRAMSLHTCKAATPHARGALVYSMYVMKKGEALNFMWTFSSYFREVSLLALKKLMFKTNNNETQVLAVNAIFLNI